MNKERPQHAALDYFPIIDDVLQVGGVPVTRLAQRVGRTPFYAYDRALMTERVALLREKMPAGLHLHYAMKANPMPAVVQHFSTLVDGIDVASVNEMRVALDTPMPADHISFAGPGKSSDELRAAVAAGITINIESEQELAIITRQGQETGFKPRIAIRVNPDFELKSSGMKMGGGPKQFGIDAERVPQVLADIKYLDLAFEGFHIFSGSQNLKAEAIMEAQEKTIALGIRLAAEAPTPVQLLNIGGGFGIPYFPGEQTLDLTPIGAALEGLLDKVKRELGDATVAIELGRFLVGEAGIYVCRVLERKISRGAVFLIADGGLHHHLAASGNFGQVLRKNYPVVVGNRVQGSTREIASVVGPLCTPLDLLADKMDLAEAEVGDLIVVFQSGAYGLTASPTSFLSHAAPLEVLV